MSDNKFPRALVRLKIEKDGARYKIMRQSINLKLWLPTSNGPYETREEACRVLADIVATKPGYFAYSDADGACVTAEVAAKEAGSDG